MDTTFHIILSIGEVEIIAMRAWETWEQMQKLNLQQRGVKLLIDVLVIWNKRIAELMNLSTG